MDFGQLLHTAQQNEKVNKNGVRYYSTKFEPPKKEKKAKELSHNIKKFLAKKEAEEKLKAEQEKKKREELLALRSQDKKATRRVNVMLKRTKSANQSVIQDAVDNENTAVTLVGPMQPDEDDYGYVSQEASAFYNKMMEKYSKMPDEPKFDLAKKRVSTNLSNTKDRVKAALEKEREEALLPHRRKRKHKDQKDDGDEEGVSYGQPDRPEERDESQGHAVASPQPPSKRHKPAPPPPMNFAELLKIAEKKQFEPIIIEKKEKEEEKPLTKKQKKEMEKEREYFQRKEARKQTDSRGPLPPISNNRIPKIGEKPGKLINEERSDRNCRTVEQKPQSSSARIPKLNSSFTSTSSSSKPTTYPGLKPNSIDSKEIRRKASSSSIPDKRNLTDANPSKSSKPVPNSKSSYRDQENYKHNSNNNINHSPKEKPKSVINNKVPTKDILVKKSAPEEPPAKRYLPGDLRYRPPEDTKPKQCSPPDVKPAKSKQIPSKDGKIKPVSSTDAKPKQFPPSDLKPKQFPPKDLKPKQMPPKDLKPKQFPPPDVRKKDFPLKKKPVMVKKGRILDDDSEYDSEMDDFIDDEDVGDDYSKYISEIFGYDKSRYRDADDDIDNMESSFAQQMKEEVISTKIGIMEDLEDMKKEEEEKKRKSVMKKRIK
ncbi:hypothetical protein NQ315_000550 [Exocentrus adspersus]|uniref:Protein SPT2 homolog n=1 Tax=Exocentrus adspersus TaxID=1586481 RepID=A0AAV8VAN2_9CUCU|nr:hypothetical protein NQ315_000550 [Exocentrus adspersus]